MLKVLYAGSPKVSENTLSVLLEKSKEYNFSICGVLSNPPSAKGRHKELTPTPVASFAINNNIPVFQPEHLDSSVREQIALLNPDILVCFAYGHIFGPKFLSIFKYGGINLHPSALPKYRGCTPVVHSILNQDEETAFTIQKISLKMDEGNILSQKKVSLDKTETADFLLDKASKEGALMIAELLKDISINGIKEGTLQQGEASYTSVIKKEDAKIDWNKSSLEVSAIVRAFYSEPTAWTTQNNEVLKILEGVPYLENQIDEQYLNIKPGTVCSFDKQKGIIVRCGNGYFGIKKIQKPGKNAMDYKSFMNGARDFVGSVLE